MRRSWLPIRVKCSPFYPPPPPPSPPPPSPRERAKHGDAGTKRAGSCGCALRCPSRRLESHRCCTDSQLTLLAILHTALARSPPVSARAIALVSPSTALAVLLHPLPDISAVPGAAGLAMRLEGAGPASTSGSCASCRL
eukprot:353393-Chlamydomonas_euryale.AAC.5